MDAAAALLECEPFTVEDKARAGILPGVKIGKGWIFPRAALIDVLCRMALANTERKPSSEPEPPAVPRGQVRALPLPPAKAGRGRRRNVPPVLPPFPGGCDPSS